MASKALPSCDVVRQLLTYDAETGTLFWRERSPDMFSPDDRLGAEGRCRIWNARYAGRPALDNCTGKCRAGSLLGRTVLAHRVVWLLVHGEWPIEVDHIDGDPFNNKLANLREVTRGQNCVNRRSRMKSTSQYLGVDFASVPKKWRAQIKPEGQKGVYLGLFNTEIEAARAYDDAARIYHGEYAKLNNA